MDKELISPDNVDDDEYIDIVASQAIDNYIYDNVPESIKKDWASWNKNFDVFYDNQKALVDDIVGDYKDVPVGKFSMSNSSKLTFGKKKVLTYGELINNTVFKEAWVGSVNRIANSGWDQAMFDSDSYYKLTEKVKNNWVNKKK